EGGRVVDPGVQALLAQPKDQAGGEQDEAHEDEDWDGPAPAGSRGRARVRQGGAHGTISSGIVPTIVTGVPTFTRGTRSSISSLSRATHPWVQSCFRPPLPWISI